MSVLLFILALFFSAPALAQADLENYYNYNTRAVQPVAPEAAPEKAAPKMDGAKRHVVTSVQKCFEEIGPEAAAKIRGRSLTPYADCQKALREKAAKDAKDAEKAESEQAEGAETPRNFKRVTETAPEAEPNDRAPEKSDTGKKTKKAVK